VAVLLLHQVTADVDLLLKLHLECVSDLHVVLLELRVVLEECTPIVPKILAAVVSI